MKKFDENMELYFSELQPEFELSETEKDSFCKVIYAEKEIFEEEMQNNEPRKETFDKLMKRISIKENNSGKNVLLFFIPVYKIAAIMLMLIGLSSLLNQNLHTRNSSPQVMKASFDSIFSFHNDSNSSKLNSTEHKNTQLADTSFEKSKTKKITEKETSENTPASVQNTTKTRKEKICTKPIKSKDEINWSMDSHPKDSI